LFTGFLSRPEITILLQDASLFVLASRHEGLPIAALEAAILGCPILLSNIQPNLDLGLAPIHYFKVGDLDELRGKLAEPHESFRADPNAILHQYDWDEISRRTSTVYSTLVAQPWLQLPKHLPPGGAGSSVDLQHIRSVAPWREFIRHPLSSLGWERNISGRGQDLQCRIRELLRSRSGPGKTASTPPRHDFAVAGVVRCDERNPEQESLDKRSAEGFAQCGSEQ
jgi:hypothetical protein